MRTGINFRSRGKLVFSFTAGRRKVNRGELPSDEPAWNPKIYAPFPAPTSLGQSPRLRDNFWGGIDVCRFKIASGRDLVLNPPQAGPPLNTIGYPYAEVGGKPLDFYDPKNFTYSIIFREI